MEATKGTQHHLTGIPGKGREVAQRPHAEVMPGDFTEVIKEIASWIQKTKSQAGDMKGNPCLSALREKSQATTGRETILQRGQQETWALCRQVTVTADFSTAKSSQRYNGMMSSERW